MESYNNGHALNIDKIQDIKKAMHDFAEENPYLEELLLNCHSKKIKTKACCKGHKNKGLYPYISLTFSKNNEQAIYAILSKLKESNYEFRYIKHMNSINIYDDSQFDGTNMFKEINEIVKSIEKNKDYYSDLPKDLQIFCDLIKIVSHDKEIKSSDIFQIGVSKENNSYKYFMMTNKIYYNRACKLSQFKKEGDNGLVKYYILEANDRLDAYNKLKNLEKEVICYTSIPDISDKDVNLDISFEHDERVRANSQIKHLKIDIYDNIYIVARKLVECRKKGINVIAIFNNIEINNYDTQTFESIIDFYNNKKIEYLKNLQEKIKNENKEIDTNNPKQI